MLFCYILQKVWAIVEQFSAKCTIVVSELIRITNKVSIRTNNSPKYRSIRTKRLAKTTFSAHGSNLPLQYDGVYDPDQATGLLPYVVPSERDGIRVDLDRLDTRVEKELRQARYRRFQRAK